jgi:hypothetical protein
VRQRSNILLVFGSSAGLLIIWALVHILTGPRSSAERADPRTPEEFGARVAASTDLAALQVWAERLVAQAPIGATSTPGSRIPAQDIPDLVHRIPAPYSPWGAYVRRTEAGRPGAVTLLSLGGFGSWAIVAGGSELACSGQTSLQLTSGVFVLRSP